MTWVTEGCQRPVLTRTWVCSFPGWWQRPRRETLWADQPDLLGHTEHCNSSPVCRSRVADRPSHRPNGPWPPEAAATAPTLEGPDIKVSVNRGQYLPSAQSHISLLGPICVLSFWGPPQWTGQSSMPISTQDAMVFFDIGSDITLKSHWLTGDVIWMDVI